MRQHPGKMRTRRIRAFRNRPEFGAGQLGNAGRQCTHRGEGAMPRRDMPEQHQRFIVFTQRCRDSAMRSVDLDTIADGGEVIGQCLAVRRGQQYGSQHSDEASAREIIGNVKEIFVLGIIDKADLCSANGSLAQTMRKDGRLRTYVRADNEHRLLILQIFDPAAQ